MDKQREAFEAWWDEHGQYVRSGGGQYEVSFAYAAWVAATAAERERAAKVCGDLWDLRAGPQALMHAAKCAAAIRAG